MSRQRRAVEHFFIVPILPPLEVIVANLCAIEVIPVTLLIGAPGEFALDLRISADQDIFMRMPFIRRKTPVGLGYMFGKLGFVHVFPF
jgi:hypothetical protein